MLFQLKQLKRRQQLSQQRLTRSEILFMQEALSADYENCDIRLREGEYQYNLAKAIASFQLGLQFPDVKEAIERLYGEEKSNDIQFIRKIQTILKKMEKSKVITILPKKNPWELQRYGLSSFKFQDTDKNLVALATDQQIKQSQNLLQSILSAQRTSGPTLVYIKTRIAIFILAIVASYMVALWALVQPIINAFIFIVAFCIAVVCSLMLGRTFSEKNL